MLQAARACHGDGHEATFNAQFELAMILMYVDLQEAISVLERALTLGKNLWGPDVVRVCDVTFYLAIQLEKVGQDAQALVHARAAVKGYNALLGPRNRKTLEASMHLARMLSCRSNTKDEGTALLRRVLEMARAALGDDDKLTIPSRSIWDACSRTMPRSASTPRRCCGRRSSRRAASVAILILARCDRVAPTSDVAMPRLNACLSVCGCAHFCCSC